jgi:hypothetical protein
MSIVAVTASNIYDTSKMKYILESANHHKFNLDIIGLKKPFSWQNRMMWVQEYLNNLPREENQIVCFTDAYDVFYLDNLEVIKSKFLEFNKNIVWSAEKMFTHQLQSDRMFFHNLCKGKSEYKYLNGGTFIGYKKSLLELFNDVLYDSLRDPEFIRDFTNFQVYDNMNINGSDQSWISHHLVKHWKKYDIELDYLCKIFYLPCQDWDSIDTFIDDTLHVSLTGKTPSIIHVPYIELYGHILNYLYYKKYPKKQNIKLINKSFSWNTERITFLEKGKLFAFGFGIYDEIDECVCKAHFGTFEHILIFNKEYTEFTSVRKIDNEVVRGRLIQ